jgi:hypothetical protein
MQWRRHRFQKGEFNPWLDEFDEIYVGLIGPRMMLMISSEIESEADKVDLWVHAPEVFFTGRFADFELVPPSSLPNKATLLIGTNDDFQKVVLVRAGRYDEEIQRHQDEYALTLKLLEAQLAVAGDSKEKTEEIARLRRNADRHTAIIAAYERSEAK